MIGARLKILTALPLTLLLASCSTSSVINDVQFAIDAVSIAAPIVSAFAPNFGPYLTTTKTGLECVLTAAEAPNATTTSVSAAIGTCLANVIAPSFPSGTPALVIAVVSAVFDAISVLIQKYGPKSPLAAKNIPMRLTHGDHVAINKMRAQLATK